MAGSAGRRGIMGDIEWVIVGGIISRMLCITWGDGGKGVASPEDPKTALRSLNA